MNEGTLPEFGSSRARFKWSSKAPPKLLIALAVALLIRKWVWMPIIVEGDSMTPALHTGQIRGINKLIYCFRPPHRGEVVAVWTDRELMIKRVLGIPGEELEARDGTFYIDGQVLLEPYVRFKDHANIAAGKLGRGRFVVVGDNRPGSLIAIVDRGRIIGRLTP